MNVVSVKASVNYDVIIGQNILENIGSYIAKINQNCKTVIISDCNVWPLYGSVVANSLQNAGNCVDFFVFSAGEESKNIHTYLQILNFLAEKQITKKDMIIALGGGVVGDIAGFAAATYLRGIPYVQVPTTLLAMVDSSVGGKTAIDLPSGKNLVGAFKQPSLVLCDTNTLDTLPDPVFLDGCAEVIKYGILFDNELIQLLSNSGPAFDREMIITKCVAYKRDIVAADEFDTDLRQKLNLGHTIGHAIESRSNYQITHGAAVAIGMAVVTKASARCKLCDQSVYDTLISLLRKFSLPTATSYSAKELYNVALSDKKRSGDSVNLIVPHKIGQCDIYPISVNELESFIKAGL